MFEAPAGYATVEAATVSSARYGGNRVEEEGIMPTRTQNPYYVMIGFFILGVIVFFILLAFWF